MWECSECATEQEFDQEAEEGQIVVCEECSAEFEIVAVDPVELQLLDIADADTDTETDDDWSEE